MGHSHVLTGLGGWLAVGPVVLGSVVLPVNLVGGHLHQPSPAGFAVGVLVTGGAAMLPDLDHEDATMARAWWPLGPMVARGVQALFGGHHREGTHSLIFPALAGLATAACLWSSIAVAVVVGLFVGFAFAGFAAGGLRLGRGLHMPATGIAGFVTWQLIDNGTLSAAGLWWLPLCVAAGCLIHTAGDWCTKFGVPWLWPFKRTRRDGRSKRYSADLFVTQSAVEKGPITIGLSLLVVALVGWRTGLWAAISPASTDSAAVPPPPP